MNEKNIKKCFLPIAEFLTNNKDKLVGDVLNEITDLMLIKSKGAPFKKRPKLSLRNSQNVVVAIFCYYYKKWFPIVGENSFAFSVKLGSSSGYSRMSKEGHNLLTQQNTLAKKKTNELLVKILESSLDINEAEKIKSDIEEKRLINKTTELGFDTEEDIISFLKNQDLI